MLPAGVLHSVRDVLLPAELLCTGVLSDDQLPAGMLCADNLL
ncbi:MAG TPA: hypothetical protein VM510_06705 [Caulifigura sp.]|nr:hypothetical protein [Caulifigura sp.]